MKTVWIIDNNLFLTWQYIMYLLTLIDDVYIFGIEIRIHAVHCAHSYNKMMTTLLTRLICIYSSQIVVNGLSQLM